MANRRMFSLDVVDTDIFLDLPISSQALYFHLGMRADDEGFVSSPKRITSMIGANQDDLKLLIAKGFIIAFEDGVIVIRHWKQNNYIQNDRRKYTIYQSQRAALTANNGIYEVDTECIQTVSKMYPQDSIGKVSKKKKNNMVNEVDRKQLLQSEKPVEYSKDFEAFWEVYPRTVGKGEAYKKYKARLNDGWSEAELLEAAKNYASRVARERTEQKYIKHAKTFLSENTPFTDFLPKGRNIEQQALANDADNPYAEWGQ